MHVAKKLIERIIELTRVCFIDYTKAFVKVKHEEIFGMKANLKIDRKDNN